jgi:5-methyltetrahydrofolate--homocysteine methyltransferase
MLSPYLFDTFVVPALTEQCQWLDHSLYHLDGTQAMIHLDSLLGIDALNAIEWTPQAGIETGGHPRWHTLYRKILNAGKSIQAVGVHKDEVLPLLDAIGGKGVYIITRCDSITEAEEMLAALEVYR